MLSTDGESAFAATNQAIQKFDDLKYQLRSTLERNAQSKIRLDRDVAELKKKAEEIYPQLALDDEQVLEDRKQKSRLLKSAEDLIEWVRETIVIHHHNHDSSTREKELTGLLERLMVKYAEIKTQLRARPLLSEFEEAQAARDKLLQTVNDCTDEKIKCEAVLAELTEEMQSVKDLVSKLEAEKPVLERENQQLRDEVTDALDDLRQQKDKYTTLSLTTSR